MFRLALIEYIRKIQSPAHIFKFKIREILIFTLGLSFIYMVISFIPIYPAVNANTGKIKISNRDNPLKMAERNPKPYSFYLDGIKGRNIFGNLSATGDYRGLSSDPAFDLKDINLVGIISGAQPQAIIEDRKTQKTHYLSEGQSGAGLRVEKIEEKQVIINYHGQRYELGL